MPANSFSGGVGLSTTDVYLRDDWSDDLLRERARSYDGLYRVGPETRPSERLRACHFPDWFPPAGADMPTSVTGGVEFGGTDRQQMWTPMALAEGTWTWSVSASNGTTNDDPLWLRTLCRSDGRGYAVRVNGDGGGSASVALVRRDDTDSDPRSETVLGSPGTATDITTETTVSVTRDTDGTQTLSVGGTDVTTARDTTYSRPQRTGVEYHGGNQRRYAVQSIRIS